MGKFNLEKIFDPKVERNLYFAIVGSLALYAIPYTHDFIATVFDYEIIGIISFGMLIGIFALYETFARLKNRKFG